MVSLMWPPCRGCDLHRGRNPKNIIMDPHPQTLRVAASGADRGCCNIALRLGPRHRVHRASRAPRGCARRRSAPADRFPARRASREQPSWWTCRRSPDPIENHRSALMPA